MSKFWIFSLSTILIIGCDRNDYDSVSSKASDSEQLTDIVEKNEYPEIKTLDIDFSEVDKKTPQGEHVLKVLYAAGTKRVYLLKNGIKETRTGGTRAWRNNNEGNLEFGKFAKAHYALGSDSRFAIFPSEYLGIKAKEILIFASKNYRNLSLFKAIHRYAPSVENNTTWYYQTVKAAAGVEKTMHQYNPQERKRIIHAMRKVEGWRAGKVYRQQPKINSTCYQRELC